MRMALRLAARAAKNGDVPCGAVLVDSKTGSVISRGFNQRELKQRPCGHAELLAIESGARKLKRWRLEDTVLYSTVEPCVLCYGALVAARVPRLVYGAPSPKFGACGGALPLHLVPLNHQPEITSGVLADECAALLKDFFAKRRQKRKEQRERKRQAEAAAQEEEEE